MVRSTITYGQGANVNGNSKLNVPGSAATAARGGMSDRPTGSNPTERAEEFAGGSRRRSARLVTPLAVAAAIITVGIVAPTSASAASGDVLSRIRSCESSGSYTAVNGSSGASGAYQFLDSTWRTVPASAGYRRAADAPASVQDAAARQLFSREGTTPWVSSSGCWRNGGSVPSSSVSSGSTTSVTRQNVQQYRHQPSAVPGGGYSAENRGNGNGSGENGRGHTGNRYQDEGQRYEANRYAGNHQQEGNHQQDGND